MCTLVTGIVEKMDMEPLASDDANRELVALGRPKRDLWTESSLNGVATLMLPLHLHKSVKSNRCHYEVRICDCTLQSALFTFKALKLKF